MPTSFPGMDPYLEAPHLWPDVHNALITALRQDLAPRLRPRYFAAIEERSYTLRIDDSKLLGQADIAVVESGMLLHEPALIYGVTPLAEPWLPALPLTVLLPTFEERRESYLEIRTADDHRLVTVLELLSPSNKGPGKGRAKYLKKRDAVLDSDANLVEIDLLRAGEAMPLASKTPASEYRLLVSRERQRPRADLFVFGVRDPIPAFPLPLLPGDDEPVIDLNSIVHALYDLAGYDLRLDYRFDPDPPLTEDASAWADQLLRSAGLRP